MGIYGQTLARITDRLRGSRRLELLSKIADAPFQAHEVVREQQLEQLRALVTHAGTRVPYYRRIFREQGITGDGIETLDDFRRIPVLTKEIVREHRDELIREDVPRERLFEHSSGGSTGVPLTFFSEREHLDWSDAGRDRNFLQCGWSPGEMVALFWGDDEALRSMPRLEFELRQHLRRTYQFSAFGSSPEDMDRWLGKWSRIKPVVVHGYASVIARFARHVLDRGERLPPTKGVFTTAEKLYEWQREEIGRAFQCKVFDCYGSSEVRNIATECTRGSMHINADFVLVEEAPADLGEGGHPLIVTSLVNYGMPFIRYRNEDAGHLLEGTCPCGRGFPLMSLDISRTTDNFFLPNGRVVHGLFFVYLLYGSEGVASFQVHQTAIDQIQVKLVPQASWSRERLAPLLKKIRREIHGLAPGQIKVDIELTPEIPRTPGGKHRYTRSDLVADSENLGPGASGA